MHLFYVLRFNLFSISWILVMKLKRKPKKRKRIRKKEILYYRQHMMND